MANSRVLHLVIGLDVGGTENILLKTLPKLNAVGVENRVCCISGRGVVGELLVKKGIEVDYLDTKTLFDLRVFFRFKKVVDKFKPDILVTYLIHADLFGRVFGKLFGVKRVICSQRGSLLNWEWLRTVDKWTSFWVDKYIVQTRVAKRKLMKRLGLPASKFVVIPNGVDLDEFKFKLDKIKKKKELGLKPGYQNLICVSNLRRGKGHERLLAAFEELFKKHKKVNLLIVGDGELKKKLLRQVKNYESRDNIYFLGQRSDVKELLRISDVFVLLTEAEGMSNAILEAMASGLPVVVSDIPENSELVEKGGEKVPLDLAIIVQRICRLLDGGRHGRLLAKRAARLVRVKYDMKKIIGLTARIYLGKI